MSADLRLRLEGVRAAALARLARLDADTAGLRTDRATDVADDEHDPEGATLSGEWSRLTGLRQEAEREVADVDDALARMDAGAYGVCADCGRGIPIDRLRALPTARRCVSCAQMAAR